MTIRLLGNDGNENSRDALGGCRGLAIGILVTVLGLLIVAAGLWVTRP